jgi:hypothetical protein
MISGGINTKFIIGFRHRGLGFRLEWQNAAEEDVDVDVAAAEDQI